MKTYEVSYSGNSSRFDGFTSMVNADSKREAVEAVYQSVLDENYEYTQNPWNVEWDPETNEIIVK